MIKLLTCPQGHYWETVQDEGAEAPATPTPKKEEPPIPVCPVCGKAPDSLPVFDLAPSEAPATPPPPREEPVPLTDAEGKPKVVGYEIQEDLGRNPAGVAVYRARQPLVNRTILLKVVLAREDPGQQAWASLRGEATALGKLTHPRIVQIFEAGERERRLFYNAVEDVPGPTLKKKLGKPLPLAETVALVEALARALHHAHQQGVVHRNVKPDSVLLGGPAKGPLNPERVKLTDFGLARRPIEGEAADVELQGHLPFYLSPEQAWGRAGEIGPATDVYALGVLLYEMLTGKPPFRAANSLDVLDQIQCKEPPRPSRSRARLPADLEAICLKCLSKPPRRRYASAQDLADDLRRFAAGEPVRARKISTAVAAMKWVRRRPSLAALLLVCVLAFVATLGAYNLGSRRAKGFPAVTSPQPPQSRGARR